MAQAGAPRSGRARWPRVEDWLLAGWVAFVAPALTQAEGATGDLFPSGRPLDGLLGLVALACAVACLAVRRPADETAPGLAASAAVGPFAGGFLLVAASAGTALGLSSGAATAIGIALFTGATLVRLRVPPASPRTRRLLVTPFILVTGTLFWRVIGAVSGDGSLTARLRGVSPAELGAVAPVVGFLVAFSAVYYAMLVYAPRQVAEREGGPVAWLVRYVLFAVGIVLGVSWLVAFAG